MRQGGWRVESMKRQSSSVLGQRWSTPPGKAGEAESFTDKHLQWGAGHDRKKTNSWCGGFTYNNFCNLPNQTSTRISPKFLIKQVSGNQKCMLGNEIFSLPIGAPWG